MRDCRRAQAGARPPQGSRSGRKQGIPGSVSAIMLLLLLLPASWHAVAACHLRILSRPGLGKIVVQFRIALRAVLGIVSMVAVVRLFCAVVALCAYDGKRGIQLPSSLPSARAVRAKGAHRDVDGARPKQHRALHDHRPAGLLRLGHVRVGKDESASGHYQYAGHDYHGA